MKEIKNYKKIKAFSKVSNVKSLSKDLTFEEQSNRRRIRIIESFKKQLESTNRENLSLYRRKKKGRKSKMSKSASKKTIEKKSPIIFADLPKDKQLSIVNNIITKNYDILVGVETVKNDFPIPIYNREHTMRGNLSKVYFDPNDQQYKIQVFTLKGEEKALTVKDLDQKNVLVDFDAEFSFSSLNTESQKVINMVKDTLKSKPLLNLNYLPSYVNATKEKNVTIEKNASNKTKEELETSGEGEKELKVPNLVLPSLSQTLAATKKTSPEKLSKNLTFEEDEVKIIEREGVKVMELEGIEFYSSNIVDYDEMKINFKKLLNEKFPEADSSAIGVWLNLSATSKGGIFKVSVAEGVKINIDQFTKSMGIKNHVRDIENKQLDRRTFTIARLQRAFAKETKDFLEKLYKSENDTLRDEAKSITKIQKLKWYGFPTSAYMNGLTFSDVVSIMYELDEWQTTWTTKGAEQNPKRFADNIRNYLVNVKRNSKQDIEKKRMEYQKIRSINLGDEKLNNFVIRKKLYLSGFEVMAEIIELAEYAEIYEIVEKVNQIRQSTAVEKGFVTYNFIKVSSNGDYKIIEERVPNEINE